MRKPNIVFQGRQTVKRDELLGKYMCCGGPNDAARAFRARFLPLFMLASFLATCIRQ
jgi:hypothetical protein